MSFLRLDDGKVIPERLKTTAEDAVVVIVIFVGLVLPLILEGC